MMETEAVVAQGTLTVTCPRDELARALGIVSRGVSTRTTVQILAGILLRAAGGKLELAATDMELSLRTSIDVPGRDRGVGRRAGPAAARPGAAAAGRRGDDRAQARGGGGRDPLRLGDLPAAHLQRGGLPAAAGGRGGGAARGRPRDGADHGRAGQPLGLSRRVAPGADRRPDALRARPAGDGRDRLLPALGQGDRGRGHGAGARGDRPGARARRARPDRAGGREDRAGRAREPGDLLDRRRAADDAPHRRAVPELQAARAREPSTTSWRCRGRSCWTSSAASR